MKLDVHSLEFWLRVKEDYSVGRSSFICNCSGMFNKAWNGTKSYDIISLAKEFLPAELGEIGDGVILFTVACPFVRERFIEWCVEKFSVDNA